MQSPGVNQPTTSLYQNRAYVLFMLVVVYTFNFIDRQIIGILAVPIKADLMLSDTQLGLMGGFAFALFYAGLGIPIAMLADRSSRTWIITVALVLWSAMTAICGLAQNFWQIFLARLGVGVGEAGGVAPAWSLIADYFPPNQRARALSIYSFGIPIGATIGIVSGGLIASAVDWRVAFFVVGAAGVLFAPIFRLTISEPQRGRFDRTTEVYSAAGIGEIVRALAAKKSFWFMALGSAFASMMGYALLFWLPSFFVRSYGITLLDASFFYAAIILIGGVAGLWLGGWTADHYGQRNRAAYAMIPATAFLVTAPLYVAGVLSTSLTLTFVLMLVPTALGMLWLGPVSAAIQHLVKPNMRTTASAVFLFINNLIGIGAGTVVIGMLSDELHGRFGDDALKYSILAGTSLYLVAAGLLFMAARYLGDDWED